MSTAADHMFMARALMLARKGLFSTDPNPRVGCVLVRDGRIVGEGWHQWAGEPHAEINALCKAGESAMGATAYVTLEPCCHQGRTGACTQALIRAGVERVVTAMNDPNPLVAGQGLKELAAAGIQVASGVLRAEAESLNPGFIMRMHHQRPYVRCKLAMSLDGRTAMASGESKWITGPAARRDVQRLRARSSAILTGIGTLLADDPSLTVRHKAPGPGPSGDEHILRQPLRIVLDPRLQTPSTAKMLGMPGQTVIATATDSRAALERLAKAGAEVVKLPGTDDTLDLHAVMAFLAKREVNEVHMESGPTLSGAMLQAGLIDELVVYMAPLLMGAGARGLFHLPGLEHMQQCVRLDIVDVRAVGRDWRVTARVINGPADHGAR